MVFAQTFLTFLYFSKYLQQMANLVELKTTDKNAMFVSTLALGTRLFAEEIGD